MPPKVPKNKATPICLSASDRLALQARIETYLTTHTAFPPPDLAPSSQCLPTHLAHSRSSYTPFSALLSTVQKASLPEPVMPPTWHWLRKFCYVGFWMKGASASGFMEMWPKCLYVGGREKGAMKEMGAVGKGMRVRMVPNGGLAIALYLLQKGDFFPSSPPAEAEDQNGLFVPAAVPLLPFSSYTDDRLPYWKALLDAEPWIVLWWTCKCVGHVVDAVWIWQNRAETEPKLIQLKADLQEDIPVVLIKLIDCVYLNLIDGGQEIGEGNNAGVNAALTKLWSHSKHQISELPVHSAEMEEIRESRDLWEEMVRLSRAGVEGIGESSEEESEEDSEESSEEESSEEETSEEETSEEGSEDEESD